MRSLDGPADENAEAAWVTELERRARELEDGSVDAVDWETARKRVEQLLQDRRS